MGSHIESSECPGCIACGKGLIKEGEPRCDGGGYLHPPDVDTGAEEVEAQASELDYRREVGGELLRALSAERDALQKRAEAAEDELGWIYNAFLDHTGPVREPPSTNADALESIFAKEGADLAALHTRETHWVELYELLGSDYAPGAGARIEELEKLLGVSE